MLTLVTGGSASGKSDYAERLLDGWTGPKIYIATMKPQDDECRARIKKHREARAGRGFETIECYTGLAGVRLPPGAAVLLDCLSNLAANELFDEEGAGENAEAAILAGVETLCAASENVVVVSNELFSDGELYTSDTGRYIGVLGHLNAALARRGERVIEVVFTIPVFHKGRNAGCEGC